MRRFRTFPASLRSGEVRPKAVLYGRRSQTNCPKLLLRQQAVKCHCGVAPKARAYPDTEHQQEMKILFPSQNAAFNQKLLIHVAL